MRIGAQHPGDLRRPQLSDAARSLSWEPGTVARGKRLRRRAWHGPIAGATGPARPLTPRAGAVRGLAGTQSHDTFRSPRGLSPLVPVRSGVPALATSVPRLVIRAPEGASHGTCPAMPKSVSTTRPSRSGEASARGRAQGGREAFRGA
ncbi:hypothetical protein GCM10027203_01780 [Nonomuraea fastidiosa]